MFLVASVSGVAANEIDDLIADRKAIEQVYYKHRLGAKPSFEQIMPRDVLEKLVRQELLKAAALKKVYGVEITPAQIDEEVRRINTTTRAPEVLAELKVALGNDPARFARTLALPVVVERELRGRFDNDDKLHAAQRHKAETVRERLLTEKKHNAGLEKLVCVLKSNSIGHVSQATLHRGSRPVRKPLSHTLEEAEVRKHFGPQAQILSAADRHAEEKLYFEDLLPHLQKVLNAQLRRPGDISGVIEMPNRFLLYVATESTSEALTVETLSIPKLDYEQWLAGREKETNSSKTQAPQPTP